MQDEKLVAGVLSFSHPYDIASLFNPYDRTEPKREKHTSLKEALQASALGIVHTSHVRMHQQLLRNSLASRTVMHAMEIGRYCRHIRNLENPDQTLSLEEFFSGCSEFEFLSLDTNSMQHYDCMYGCNNEMAKAIMTSCPKFKGLIINSYTCALADNKALVMEALKTYASGLKKLVVEGMYDKEVVSAMLELPHLTDLELLSIPENEIYDQFDELFSKFTRLERLHLRIDGLRSVAVPDTLSRLPLRELTLRSRLGNPLRALANMTHLQKIDISDGRTYAGITYNAVKQFILARRATLKEIVLPKPWASKSSCYPPQPSLLTTYRVNRLKAEFPDISIKYRLDDDELVTAVPVPQAPGEEE